MNAFLSKHPRLTNSIPFIFVFIGLFFVGVGIMNNREEQKQRSSTQLQTSLRGQAYVRTILCFASTPVEKRHAHYIENCYDEVEKDTGIKIERYGAAETL